MNLWLTWYRLVRSFQVSCFRRRTYSYLVLILAGFTVRWESDGVSSLMRGLGLGDALYRRLLHFFNDSRALSLEWLTRVWVETVLRFFSPRIVNGRLVLLGDGFKNPKEGRKMPGVKSLHQESSNNSKPPFIMGHSIQSLSLLVRGLSDQVAAVPLLSRIHEGIKKTPKDQKTLLEKMVEMTLLVALLLPLPVYLVADNYYAGGDLMRQLVGHGHHLITRARKNPTAYRKARPSDSKSRGRPAVYGEKLKLKPFFEQALDFLKAVSPLPGDVDIEIEYRSEVLLWKPLKRGAARFVWVKHPVKGNLILMSTDLELAVLEIIRLYGYRYSIEGGFRDAVQVVGTYAYHFWMREMTPIKRPGGTQYLHRKDGKYRQRVERKLEAYHRYMQCGTIAQGLMMYLALYHSQEVWSHFQSWYRTQNRTKAPSVRTVAYAMRFGLLEFRRVSPPDHELRKILEEHTDLTQVPDYQMAA